MTIIKTTETASVKAPKSKVVTIQPNDGSKSKSTKATVAKTKKTVAKATAGTGSHPQRSAKAKTGGSRPEGKTTGLGVQATWIHAFTLAQKHKWNDAAISSFMKSEFPGRESSVFDSVAGVRSKFAKLEWIPSTTKRFNAAGEEVEWNSHEVGAESNAAAKVKPAKAKASKTAAEPAAKPAKTKVAKAKAAK